MFKQQVGVVGMAVMGQNLALNIKNHNYSVSVFNRSPERTEDFFKRNNTKNIVPYYSVKKFVESLEKPRIVLLMVKSGKATDDSISSIVPYLQKGDVLIDGGNAFYKDTIRRNQNLFKYGINFIGAGISGGEEGALKGPSIMPGGQKKAYSLIEPIFIEISAKYKGKPCVSYIGSDGSGHYVKMIHNGIEYSDMQLISESYFLLKQVLGMNNKELSNTFSQWNQGELNSYLVDITKNIFVEKDNKNNYLIDMILDQAENKGTGKWMSQSALDLGEPLSLVTESVFARYISSLKIQRVLASKVLKGPKKIISIENKSDFIEDVRRSLYLGKIISYAQGFSQLKRASQKYNWNLKYGNIAQIFQSGCIIRAHLLKRIKEAYWSEKNIVNLLLTPYFKRIANEYQSSLRKIVAFSVSHGIAVPGFSASVSYYDSYRSLMLPANLIQAQRDYFGAHTYKRIDQNGTFHTNWLK